MKDAPQRGDVYLISLDPTQGREIPKTRPCVVVSPDELNAHLSTGLGRVTQTTLGEALDVLQEMFAE